MNPIATARHLFLRSRLDVVFLTALLAGLIGLLLAFGAGLDVKPDTLTFSGGFFIFNVFGVLFLRWLRHGAKIIGKTEIMAIARDWFPFTILLIVYENLSLHTALIRSEPIDAALALMEERWWGRQPTVWLEPFTHPALTDLMAAAYALHFPLPFSLALGLYVMGRRAQFRELSMAMIFCNVAGFVLYLAFPAGPPRFYLRDAYGTETLAGYIGLHEWTDRLWDDTNPMIAHSTFPSLHVAFSTVATLYAFRRDHWGARRRWIGPLILTLTLSLWFSTVYLRHHWTPDIAVGFAVGLASVLIARNAASRYPERL